MRYQSTNLHHRRQVLRLLGAAAGSALFFGRETSVDAASGSCAVATPQVTEGPYWVDEHLFRSDIRTDPATGVARAGIPLTLTITVMNSSSGCSALSGAFVDIWHCDAKGIYSDESTYNPGGGTGNVNTQGQRFLRGYQITDANGQVTFTTIYPGWYSGRTIHIHVRVRTYSGSTELTNFVTQVFFDDAVTNTVLSNSAYSRTSARDTTNNTDGIYNGAANKTAMLATLVSSGSAYAASITIDLAATAPATAAPALGTNSVVNAASGAPGVAPGSWVSLFGSNLATSTYAALADDLVSGYLPTNLKNTTVEIDGALAFLDYVSPTQINLLAPPSSKTGSVSVVVTNGYGTTTTNATLQPILPGLFSQNGYILAVRVSDSAIINGAGSVAAGDVLELYGTGFGPTSPAGTPGLVFSGAYPTTNAVTVTIGGVQAQVQFAGLIAAGLYQINVTVPAGLPAGDQPVVATVAGLSSQATAMLKVAG